MGGSGVGHLTDILIEVDKGLSLFFSELHGLVVLLEEHVGNLFGVHC